MAFSVCRLGMNTEFSLCGVSGLTENISFPVYIFIHTHTCIYTHTHIYFYSLFVYLWSSFYLLVYFFSSGIFMKVLFRSCLEQQHYRRGNPCCSSPQRFLPARDSPGSVFSPVFPMLLCLQFVLSGTDQLTHNQVFARFSVLFYYYFTR